MKVLGLHFCSEEGNVEGNVARSIELIRQWVGEHTVDSVVLPELFTCGYCGMDLRPYAESKDGSTVRAFSALAEELDVVIGFGFVEESGSDKVYNSYAIVEPGNTVYVYRKTHLHMSEPGSRINEPEYMIPGDYLGIADTKLGRLGIMICYDGHFLEVARSLVLAGAEVILWPSRSTGFFGSVGMIHVRAMENMVPIVCVDGTQTGGYIPATGHSMIADHMGTALCEFVGEEGVLYAEVDTAKAAKDRASATDVWGVYRVRRPELYQLIASKTCDIGTEQQ